MKPRGFGSLIVLLVVALVIAGGSYFYITHLSSSGVVVNSAATTTAPSNNSSLHKNPLPPQTIQSTNTMDTLIAQYKDLLTQQVALMRKDTLTPGDQAQSDSIDTKMSSLRSQLNALNTNGVEGGIQVDAYGYNVSVKVNGQDIGILGGMSEGTRLYNTEHFSYSFAAPSIKSQYALVKGQNTISVTYTKTDPKASPMKVDVFAYTPPADLVIMNIAGDSGTINETFDIEHDKPAGVQTITVSK
jgi:flagellar basal body-associated protein FliL